MVYAGVESILDGPRIAPNLGSGKKAFHLSPSGPGEERSGGEESLWDFLQPSTPAPGNRCWRVDICSTPLPWR